MAKRYGTRAPAESGWNMLSASLRDALTAPTPKPVGEASRVPLGSLTLAIVLSITFPITMVIVNSWLGQFASLMWIAFILGAVALALAQIWQYRRDKEAAGGRTISRSQVQDQTPSYDRVQERIDTLISETQQGNFSALNTRPEVRLVAANCFAKQQVGLAMDQELPAEVQTAHDVHVNVNVVGAERVGAYNNAAIRALRASARSARNGETENRFATAMAKQLRTRNGGTIDHLIVTSAGIIVAATVHWPGTLGLDEEGRFSAGQNHPANECRQAAVSVLAALADQVNRGRVALILLIIDGGFVLGSGVETEIDGHRIIAIEREHAVDFIAHVHAQGTLSQVPDMRFVDEMSPQLTM